MYIEVGKTSLHFWQFRVEMNGVYKSSSILFILTIFFFLKKTFFRLCFGFVRTFAFSLLLIRILLRNCVWVGACVSVSFQTKKTLWKTKKYRELISDAIYLNGSNEVFQLSFFFLWQKTLNLFQTSAIITVIVFIILPQRIDSSSTHRKENKPLGIFQSF